MEINIWDLICFPRTNKQNMDFHGFVPATLALGPPWHARDPDPFGSQGIFHVEILHEMPRRQQEAAAMDQDDERFLS